MKAVVIVGSGVVSIPPRGGGATELIIHEISKSMPEQLQVYVLDRKEPYNKKKELVGNSIYLRYKVPKFGNVFLLRLTELVFGLKGLKKIRDINKSSPVGAVHAHTVFTALPLAVLKPLLPGKLIYTCHNPAWTIQEDDFFNRIIKKVEGYVMRRSDFVTTVSDIMRKSIIKNAGVRPERIQRIYNFVDTEKFSPRHEKSWARKNGIEGPIVMFVGKLIRNKGIGNFLQAARIVLNRRPEAKFVVVGPMSFEYQARNTWRDLAEQLGISGSVIFTGALSDKDLAQAYSSADIFCFPTLRESFGIVLIEAMASGLPVITSDLPVTEEVAGQSGMLVDPNDPEEIAWAITALMDSDKERKILTRKSIARSKMFELRRIMSEYAKLYARVLKSF